MPCVYLYCGLPRYVKMQKVLEKHGRGELLVKASVTMHTSKLILQANIENDDSPKKNSAVFTTYDYSTDDWVGFALGQPKVTG